MFHYPKSFLFGFFLWASFLQNLDPSRPKILHLRLRKQLTSVGWLFIVPKHKELAYFFKWIRLKLTIYIVWWVLAFSDHAVEQQFLTRVPKRFSVSAVANVYLYLSCNIKLSKFLVVVFNKMTCVEQNLWRFMSVLIMVLAKEPSFKKEVLVFNSAEQFDQNVHGRMTTTCDENDNLIDQTSQIKL